jgi:peptide/nickel transport system substrate-binding protein
MFLVAGTVAGASYALVACTGKSVAPTVSGVPTSASGKGELHLGELEGAEIVTDPSLFPTTFQEAPELAALVAAGELPPVAERIGQDPLVLKPVHETGHYIEGAVIRRGTIGPDIGGPDRFANGPTPLLTTDYLGQELRPNIAKAWEKNEDATQFNVHLREGMRWSDGEPFTADDFVFWYEDIWLEKDSGAYDDQFIVNGKSCILERIDDYTIRYIAPEPFALFEWLFLISEEQAWAPYAQGAYFPKHYLSQFHPKYVGEAKAKQLAEEAGAKDWAQHLIQQKSDWLLNADLPVLMPWKVVKGSEVNSGHLKLERNPYSIWVDTDGNQLPYVGEISFIDAGDVESLHLSQMAGEYDFQEAFLDPTKLPLLLENQEQSNYEVRLAPGESVDLGVMVNLSYEDDSEIGELLRTADFRRALSMGIDRDQLNEAIFLGLARPSGYGPGPTNRYYPGEEYETKWATLDLDAANDLLDGLGLTMGDDGYRQRRDGKGRLRLNFAATEGTVDFVAAGEMLTQHWGKIGIDLNVENLTNQLLVSRAGANKVQLSGHRVGSTDVFLDTLDLYPAWAGGLGALSGVLYARWFQTNGEGGKEPYPELLELIELWRKGNFTIDDAERVEIGKQWWRQAIDACLQIGGVAGTISDYGIYCARTNVGNVPSRYVNGAIGATTPMFNSWPQSFYYTA